MKTLLIFSLLVISTVAVSQKELENTYISQNSVHGGTEDGGISILTRYTFIARNSIKLMNVINSEGDLILEKGDSIIINVQSFESYSSQDIQQNEKELEQAVSKEKFKVLEYKNVKYINISNPKELPLVLTYKIKKKKFIATCKSEIDQAHTSYAP